MYVLIHDFIMTSQIDTLNIKDCIWTKVNLLHIVSIL